MPDDQSVNDIFAEALGELPEAAVDSAPKDAQDQDLDATLSEGVSTPSEPQPERTPADGQSKEPPSAGVAPTADDFSDDRPWTPERLKNARALLDLHKAEAEAARAKAHDLYQDAVGRAKKFQRRFEKFQVEKSALQVERQQLMAGLNALRQGTPEQRVTAIQWLTGQDGVKWLEEMNYELATGGKKREVDPAVAELRQTVARLEQERVAEQEQIQLAHRANQMQATVDEWKAGITQAVAQRADIAPISANIAAKAPARYAEAIMAVKVAEMQARGNPIDDRTAVDILEAHLRNERDLYHPSNGTTGSGPEAAGNTAAANPSTTPSAPLIPSMATEPGGGHRPMSEREAIQAVAQELPQSFWDSIGFS